MKLNKLRTKLVAIFLAAAMTVTLTACGNKEDDGNNQGDGTGTTAGGDTTDTPGDDPFDPESRPSAPVEVLDFGAIRFSSNSITIPPDTAVNIGGNLQAPGGGAFIRLAGFLGDATDSWLASPANIFTEGEPIDTRDWSFLVSNHGPFWENVSRIEANFFLEGPGEAEEIGSLETFLIGGGMLGHNWAQSNNNEISEWDEDNGGDGFAWGNVFHVTWDIDAFASAHGSRIHPTANPEGAEYTFDRPATDIRFEGAAEANMQGGGINSFGFQIKNVDLDNEVTITIRWTNVVIYVHDLDLYNEQIAELSEATDGHFVPSANVEGRVRQVE